MNNEYWASFNYLEFKLPLDAVLECHHQGACDNDVEYWQKELKLNLDRDSMIKELDEYGAWDNLKEQSNTELEQKLIWIAAGNIQEDETFNKQ